MNPIKTIIVDDERLAREEIKRSLMPYSNFFIVGEAANAYQARTLIEEKRPDLLFLDIQMPGKSGFDLLEEIPFVPPFIVFTTAYNQYAVQAFEVNALDYLVKPVREERFERTIQRIKETYAQRVEELSNRLFIKDGDQVFFISPQKIRLIESLDNYSKIFFEERFALMKRSLSLLEKQLDPKTFFRINRRQMVNLHFIRNVRPSGNNRLFIELLTGEVLELSNRQSIKFRKIGKI